MNITHLCYSSQFHQNSHTSIVYGLFGMLMFNNSLQLGYSMLSGVILAIGRIVGETAALMYTSGTVAKVAGLMDSGTTLALHMYKQASEGLLRQLPRAQEY